MGKMKIFMLAVVSFFISSAFAESILNESAFTQRYANAVITNTEVVSADIKGRLEIEMTYSGGGTSTAYLDNAYMNYLSDPEELDVIIESYISALFQIEFFRFYYCCRNKSQQENDHLS